MELGGMLHSHKHSEDLIRNACSLCFAKLFLNHSAFLAVSCEAGRVNILPLFIIQMASHGGPETLSDLAKVTQSPWLTRPPLYSQTDVLHMDLHCVGGCRLSVVCEPKGGMAVLLR